MKTKVITRHRSTAETALNIWLDDHPDIEIIGLTQSGSKMITYTIIYK